jgi:hypothetical protein
MGVLRQPSLKDSALLTRECCLALDHLRSALDMATPQSVSERKLLALIRQVADLLDTLNGGKRG